MMNLAQAQQSVEMPTAVFTIWIIVLVIAVVIILPLTIYLLQRTLNASRGIERYFGEMRDAGVGIAENTSHISALDDTIGVATGILTTAGSLDEHSATIATVLTDRANG